MVQSIDDAFQKVTNNNKLPSGSFISPRWDVSQERMFMENLLGQRFNFFMAFFSIVVAGYINTRDVKEFQLAVIFIGMIICLLLMFTLFRTQHKLDAILSIISKDEEHPVTVTNSLVRGFSVRRLVGYYVPSVCVFVLVLAALASVIDFIPKITNTGVGSLCGVERPNTNSTP